jgi:hypothetical protein
LSADVIAETKKWTDERLRNMFGPSASTDDFRDEHKEYVDMLIHEYLQRRKEEIEEGRGRIGDVDDGVPFP